MAEREKRFNGEINILKHERDNLLMRISTQISEQKEKEELKTLTDSIQVNEEERIKLLTEENKILQNLAQSMKEKFEDEAKNMGILKKKVNELKKSGSGAKSPSSGIPTPKVAQKKNAKKTGKFSGESPSYYSRK